MNKTNYTKRNDTLKKQKVKNAPFGSWKSPITSSMLTQANKGLSEPLQDGNDIYWLESRPLEKGRNCIVQFDNKGNKKDVLPAPLNARSRVNEYGGGSYCVHNGIVYFVLFDDQRIYSINTQASSLDSDLNTDSNNSKPAPIALTPEEKNIRFGDLTFDPIHHRLLAVCEDHSHCRNKKSSEKESETYEPKTYIVSIKLDDSNNQLSPEIILSGDDFYSNPSISPNGKKISWLSWNHPNMPWDETCCWTADVSDNGQLSNHEKIADQKDVSIFQPTWSPDNILYFASDQNNWWNIYSFDPESTTKSPNEDKIKCIYSDDAEYATPQWVFGLRTFGFLNAKTLLTAYTKNGFWYLAKITITDHNEQNVKKDIATGATDISYVSASKGQGIFIAANSKHFESLYKFENDDTDKNKEISLITNSGKLKIDAEYISIPEPVSFPTTSCDRTNNRTSNEINNNTDGHAFFYPPTNKDYRTQNETEHSQHKPPLLVFCHGGPTAATHAALNLKIQFWTSRGFAVADINYGGSTGYGRQYRDRLKKQWGLVDVQDAIDCVHYLIRKNKINPNKTAIRGGSAGGYTVLSALTFHNTFKAGTSLYGIGDLETLATDTHKFESRYLDQLVGPYPEDKIIYQDRSPINFVEQLNCPVLFLQGLKDKIVPPNQAESMVNALSSQKIPVAYVTFSEEGHGFRQAKNIQYALDAELYFYSKVFKFPLTEHIQPIEIKNLDDD